MRERCDTGDFRSAAGGAARSSGECEAQVSVSVSRWGKRLGWKRNKEWKVLRASLNRLEHFLLFHSSYRSYFITKYLDQGIASGVQAVISPDFIGHKNGIAKFLNVIARKKNSKVQKFQCCILKRLILPRQCLSSHFSWWVIFDKINT